MSSTPPPDHYKVLGVAKDAQVAEIRLAYRKLVLKCHPDKVQDPALKAQKQEEFQKVQQAYELLTDEDERRKYDDQVKLAELKEQLRKTNVSGTPRSSSKYAEYEIRTAEPRASSYKPSTNVPPPAAKGYTYPRSYEDDVTFSPRVYQTGSSRTTRRETTYVDSRSKRESERDREAREKEKDRERRKKAEKEDAARREKEAKEAKEARREKKSREKQRDKDIKRESEDKKKHTKATAYVVDDFSDDAPAPAPKPDKKKSSSKKYDEKRDRSSQREDIHIVSPQPPAVRSFPEYVTSKYVEQPPRTVPAAPEPSSSWEDTHSKLKDAASYIEAARAKEGVAGPGGLKRSMTYAPRMNQPPAAPTPPPAPNQTSPFAAPDDDDVRRSAARPRRGSTESNRPRDRYSKSSREPLNEPVVMSASPNNRHAAHPAMSGSPPHLSRTHTMPADAQSYPRAVPITRSQTYNYGEATDPRGRNRTRYQSQIDEEDADSDDVRDQRARDRRHRGSRREQSVDQGYGETSRYPSGYESSRQPSYSRRAADPESDRYAYHSSGYNDARPSMPVRDSSYSASAGAAHFAKVKTSKAYGYDDIQYTNYHHSQKPREEYTYA
ncbi:DnaJ-like protein JJ3, involved inDiphthamide biosynthesis [Trichoderma simmonsii]|uniref:DnaJ-like protein JJ3, involved inDiphthamide biosynthesis n=1 Tax=Trichoderma simmonsii TaxID=1491479 RepID=A0A8G0PRE5_9HYPO|nr:DnaJ-like protein JJ3, involved inDiphthamide biosynthesis [Trichoderma simmonsii]